MSLQPRTRRNERSASSMPAAIQCFFMDPSFHRVTRPVVRRAIEIVDSMQFVLVRVRGEGPGDAHAPDGQHVLQASRRLAPASGWWAWSSWARRRATPIPGRRRGRRRWWRTGGRRFGPAPWQVAKDSAPRMQGAPLHHRLDGAKALAARVKTVSGAARGPSSSSCGISSMTPRSASSTSARTSTSAASTAAPDPGATGA